MVMIDRMEEIFQDARELQASAVERLDQGDIRDAAEKAWGGDEARHRRPRAGADRRGAGADTGDRGSPPDAHLPGR